DLRGRTVLVVGLGAVGLRKAEGLATAGAYVVGVDPAVDEGQTLPIAIRREPYRAAHLKGVRLAIAAATAAVNRRVVADARRAGGRGRPARRPRAGRLPRPRRRARGAAAPDRLHGGGKPRAGGRAPRPGGPRAGTGRGGPGGAADRAARRGPYPPGLARGS